MGFNNRASWIPALYLIQLTLGLSFIQLQLPSERLCTRLKVQLTPKFFFRRTKSSYHPAYLCEKILVIAFFLIFL